MELESSTNNFLAWAASLLNTAPSASAVSSESKFCIGAHSLTDFTQDPFLPFNGNVNVPIKSTSSPTTPATELLESAETLPTSTSETEIPKSKRRIRTHIDHSKQTSRLKYQCPKCFLWFLKPIDLFRHDENHHTHIRPHVCSDPRCGESFYCVNDCKRHYRVVHLRPFKYTCAECSASYERNIYLLQHQLRASHPLSAKNNTASITSVSTRLSNNVYSLSASVVIATGFENRPYTVDELTQAMKRQAPSTTVRATGIVESLDTEETFSVSGTAPAKPYATYKTCEPIDHSKQTSCLNHQCPKCSLWFKCSGDVLLHDDHHHTHIRSIVCSDPRCGEMFFYADASKKHYNIIHTKQLQYTCAECSASYAFEYYLLRHQLRAIHPLSGKNLIGTDNADTTILASNLTSVGTKRSISSDVATGFVEEVPQTARRQAPSTSVSRTGILDSLETVATFSTEPAKRKTIDHSKQSRYLRHQCLKCSLWFSSPIEVRNHDDHVHTHTRRFVCAEPRCGETFSMAGASRNHYSNVHSGTLKFSCSECDASYYMEFNLSKHIQRATHPLSAKTLLGTHSLLTSVGNTTNISNIIYPSVLEASAPAEIENPQTSVQVPVPTVKRRRARTSVIREVTTPSESVVIASKSLLDILQSKSYNAEPHTQKMSNILSTTATNLRKRRSNAFKYPSKSTRSALSSDLSETEEESSEYSCDERPAKRKKGKAHNAFDHSQTSSRLKQSSRFKHKCPRDIRLHDDCIHTLTRNLVCEDPRCGETFTSLSICKEHYRRAHSGPIKYTCVECEASYTLERQLIQHQERATHPFLMGITLTSSSVVSALGLNIINTATPCPTSATVVHASIGVNIDDESAEPGIGETVSPSKLHQTRPVLRYYCATCGQCFPSSDHRRRHESLKHGVAYTNLCPEPRCGESFMDYHQAVVHHSRVHMAPTNPPPSWSGLRMQTCVDCGAGYTFLHQLQRHRARASHPLQLLSTFMNDALVPVLPGVAVGFHSDHL